MQNQSQSPRSLTLERFGRVAAAVQGNLGTAVDVVVVHNEKVIQGFQPRASLNRAIVVMAVAAWDRFVADIQDACAGQDGSDFWDSGASKSRPKQLYAGPASRLLDQAAATQGPFLGRIRMRAATGGSGVRLQNMEELTGGQCGKNSGLTFSQHLNQWVLLRNALAHNSIRLLAASADDPSVWRDPDIGDPYASIRPDQPRWRLWESDATGDSSVPDAYRLTGATVQAWSARSCLAFIIQLVDWLIVDIAQAHGRGWDPALLRLPSAWFARDLPDRYRNQTRAGFPGTYRGQILTRYAHWSLWEGPVLYRRGVLSAGGS
jgi:hypothetical protein